MIGFPIERAASLLTRLGFQVQRVDSVAEPELGRVIGIDPSPGTQLELPSRIRIVVSLGLPDTVPPDTGAVSTSRGEAESSRRHDSPGPQETRLDPGDGGVPIRTTPRRVPDRTRRLVQAGNKAYVQARDSRNGCR
jgi:beta-lactam-binding protein with PASTA domain